MGTYRVLIARDRSEYANITVEAESADAAEARVRAAFVDNADDPEMYAKLVDNVEWAGGEDAQNERIVDVEDADAEEPIIILAGVEDSEPCDECGQDGGTVGAHAASCSLHPGNLWSTDATQGRVCASCGESPCLESCGACDYEAPSGER
jgi:hypothetical protein